MKKIVFLDAGTLPRAEFAFDFPFELTSINNCTQDEVKTALKGHEIALTNKVPITRSDMEANPDLKLIAVTATGFNMIDVKAARELGITVCNVADYSTVSVAEHAFMMMISLMHRLPLYQKRIEDGEWQASPFFSILAEPIYDLAGKTLGVFGKGAIGSKLGEFATCFGMKVLYAERKGADRVREGYAAFDEVLTSADVVSLHVPLNEDTANMIDAESIARMKKGAILINVSRGGLVDESALANALRSGQLGGAGVDVATKEPPLKTNPLLANDLGNFILTPHSAWASEEAVARLMVILHNNINQFVAGNPVNVVN